MRSSKASPLRPASMDSSPGRERPPGERTRPRPTGQYRPLRRQVPRCTTCHLAQGLALRWSIRPERSHADSDSRDSALKVYYPHRPASKQRLLWAGVRDVEVKTLAFPFLVPQRYGATPIVGRAAAPDYKLTLRGEPADQYVLIAEHSEKGQHIC
jgi:hypothetical protein